MIKAVVFDAYGTLYDVQSVAEVIEAAFPRRGQYVTQLWRLKQLEYTWLRSMMGAYADFWTVTRDSLAYTLATLGLEPDDQLLEDAAAAYNRLRLYPEVEDTLAKLAGRRLAILSNGSPAMLAALVESSGMGRVFEAVMSTHDMRVYKPDPNAYVLVGRTLGIAADEVLFVSSNGFDAAGAKAFGFRVAQVERVDGAVLTAEIETAATIGPQTMFKALRQRPEILGHDPDVRLPSLAALPSFLAADGGGPGA